MFTAGFIFSRAAVLLCFAIAGSSVFRAAGFSRFCVAARLCPRILAGILRRGLAGYGSQAAIAKAKMTAIIRNSIFPTSRF
jgi:hypothetical protein